MKISDSFLLLSSAFHSVGHGQNNPAELAVFPQSRCDAGKATAADACARPAVFLPSFTSAFALDRSQQHSFPSGKAKPPKLDCRFRRLGDAGSESAVIQGTSTGARGRNSARLCIIFSEPTLQWYVSLCAPVCLEYTVS